MNHARVQINTHQSKWAQQFSNFNPLEKVHAGGGHVCFGFISARHIAEIQNVFGDQWLWPQVGLCKNKTASRLPSSTSVVLSSSRHYVTLCSEAELNWMEYSRCIWALSCFPMVFDSDVILLFFSSKSLFPFHIPGWPGTYFEWPWTLILLHPLLSVRIVGLYHHTWPICFWGIELGGALSMIGKHSSKSHSSLVPSLWGSCIDCPLISSTQEYETSTFISHISDIVGSILCVPAY